MAALCRDVFISKLRKFRLFLLYSSIAILLFHIYPTILSRFFTLVEKILRSADRRLFVLYIFFNLRLYQRSSVFWFWSLLRKESKLKTMKRRNASDDGERGNKKLREQAVCELSTSQESSSTQSVKDILRRRIEQKGVQQNEERFSRSQNNTTLSNWDSILSNLGYFCEVRSIIAACGKIHGAYSCFDYWTVKGQVHLH